MAFTLSSCANRGMEAPDHEDASGVGGAAGGQGGASAGHGGTAGVMTGKGGSSGAGIGGQAGGVGGAAGGIGGVGGSLGGKGGGAEGGTTGLGGMSGGTAGGGAGGGTAGGVGGGGPAGNGGTAAGGAMAGTGGGVGGTSGSGGMAGMAGSSGGTDGGVDGGGKGGGGTGGGGTGGSGTGGTAGSGGGTAGRGGSGGTGGMSGGGAGGAAPYVCPLGGVVDCTAAKALDLSPDGTVSQFSALEWDAATSKWCNALGLDGSIFTYMGAAPSTSTYTIDTTAHALRLNLTVSAGQYAGGGLTFDSCVDASAFTMVEFTAAVVSGSLTGCNWQVQLQTQDQKPTTATDPTGGTCNPNGAGGCYRYPAAPNLAAPGTGMTYMPAFTTFTNPASSTIPLRTQIVGIQWQVNSSSGTGSCTVGLRIDDVRFR